MPDNPEKDIGENHEPSRDYKKKKPIATAEVPDDFLDYKPTKSKIEDREKPSNDSKNIQNLELKNQEESKHKVVIEELDAKIERRKKYLKTSLIELIFYLIFIVVILLVAFLLHSPYSYFFTNSLYTLYVDRPISKEYPDIKFSQIIRRDEFWSYLNGTLMDGVFWEVGLGGKILTDEELGYVLYNNKIQGLVQLRQLRVRKNSCVIDSAFRSMIQQCFAAYSSESMQTDKLIGIHGIAFQTTHNGTSYNGELQTYGNEGYAVLLAKNRFESIEILNSLNYSGWIDRGTRAVFIDFIVRNPMLNIFCHIRLVGEFPLTGGVYTSWQFRTMVVNDLSKTTDYLILILVSIAFIFTIYFLIKIILQAKRRGFKYCLNTMTLFEIVIIILTIFIVVWHIIIQSGVNTSLKYLGLVENYYPAAFEWVAYFQIVLDYCIVVLLVLIWLRLFKYFSFNNTLALLKLTLWQSTKDIMAFGIMYFIIFLAFAQAGYLLFGHVVPEFRSFTVSIVSMFRIMIGDINYELLEKQSPIMGPLFFIFYVFVVCFILMSVFLAIIVDSYMTAKAHIARKSIFNISMTEYLDSICGGKKRKITMYSVYQWIDKMINLGYQMKAIEQTLELHKRDGVTKASNITAKQMSLLEEELENLVTTDYLSERMNQMNERLEEFDTVIKNIQEELKKKEQLVNAKDNDASKTNRLIPGKVKKNDESKQN